MAKDEAKDTQIADARLNAEPICQHCGKTGLRIIDKDLMHRGKEYKYDDPEEVLFTLKCTHCEKNSACWKMVSSGSASIRIAPSAKLSWTRKAPHTAKSLLRPMPDRLAAIAIKTRWIPSRKKEVIDPDLEKDKEFYCLRNEKIRNELRDMRYRMEEMARLGKEFKEKEDNKHIYDAMKEMKKPKIAELAPLLSPVLEKAGYIEFHLDKPEIGKDVFIGFSCLDSKIRSRRL